MPIASKWRYVLELDGQPLELPEGEILLGRSRSCTVTLPDPSISRQHAKLMLREGKVRLRDLNSSNGTYVNDTRVHSETDVIDGDRIVLGETEMRFRSAAPGGATAEVTQRAEPQPTSEEEVDAPTLRRTPGLPDLGAPPPAPVAARSAAPPSPRAASSKVPTGELLPPIQLDPRPPAAAAPAKPVVPQVAKGYRAAGFWVRAAALLLDGLWIGALAGAAVALPFLLDISASLASTLTAIAGLAGAVVVIAGWAKWGTTPGKRLLGLYVCPVGGSPGIGLGKALLRYLGYFLSAALLGMGFLLVAFSREKRGLHDLIAGTAVVRR
jgi:uncharacterized RDD family membrane protein YckC